MRKGFDQFAESYDEDLRHALSLSGENKEYFAKRRVDWTWGRLNTRGVQPRSVLDFGCGTGTATPYLQSMNVDLHVGVDISEASIQVAKETFPELSQSFLALSNYAPAAQFDLAFTNGVFHHIPPEERTSSARYVFDALKAGGYFAYWENNPWNPGTRYVMSNCTFDHDAITLSPPESRRLLSSAGFEVVSTDFLFIFPRLLSRLRPLENHLAKWPLGGQYMVLCHKPGGER